MKKKNKYFEAEDIEVQFILNYKTLPLIIVFYLGLLAPFELRVEKHL